MKNYKEFVRNVPHLLITLVKKSQVRIFSQTLCTSWQLKCTTGSAFTSAWEVLV